MKILSAKITAMPGSLFDPMPSDMKLKIDLHHIEYVGGRFYRSSQSRSLSEAIQHGAYDQIEESSTYSTALDVLLSMRWLANRMEHKSAENDIRIQLVVNKTVLPECYLAEATDAIDTYLESVALFRACCVHNG